MDKISTSVKVSKNLRFDISFADAVRLFPFSYLIATLFTLIILYIKLYYECLLHGIINCIHEFLELTFAKEIYRKIKENCVEA